jgi:hemin uptake protein HemP
LDAGGVSRWRRPIVGDAGADDDPARRLTYRTEDLLGGRAEAWIAHRGELYRLRLMPAGKLNLTK